MKSKRRVCWAVHYIQVKWKFVGILTPGTFKSDKPQRIYLGHG